MGRIHPELRCSFLANFDSHVRLPTVLYHARLHRPSLTTTTNVHSEEFEATDPCHCARTPVGTNFADAAAFDASCVDASLGSISDPASCYCPCVVNFRSRCFRCSAPPCSRKERVCLAGESCT